MPNEIVLGRATRMIIAENGLCKKSCPPTRLEIAAYELL